MQAVERSTMRWTNSAPFFQSGIPELANSKPVHADPLFNMWRSTARGTHNAVTLQSPISGRIKMSHPS
jgi:hypothetical protein